MAERHAQATWHGTLVAGHGQIDSTGSGAISGLPVSWKARTETSDGMTSPEELLAAANATCYAMAFSHALAGANHPAEQLQVAATCTFDRKPEGGWKVGSMHLTVKGRVPGIEADEFSRMAEEAGHACPISGAIKGNVDIQITATLED